MNCPFCGRDPFHRVDNGLGMEAVAVTCCDLGDALFRGARPDLEEVTLSWEQFISIAQTIGLLRERVANCDANHEIDERGECPECGRTDTHSHEIV